MTEENNQSCSLCATDILEEKQSVWKQKEILIIIVSGLLLVAGLYLEIFTDLDIFAQFIFGLAAVIPGYTIAGNGLRAVQKKHLDMNILMILAAIGAFSIGHGEEGAAVIFLFFLAEFLEDRAGERARRSIAGLLQLAPDTAVVKVDNGEKILHVHEIKRDNIVVVRPGDKIPLDGEVIAGSSTVNQASITGESIPVTKNIGDTVFAGTINQEGYLEFQVTKVSEETMLSKIVNLVKEAQRKKSKTERFIDRFARYYTPSVIFLAFAVMILPTLLWGLSFKEWFYRGLILLVVSCPCALAISTPVSMISGITSAARHGTLIKAGHYLEEIRNSRVLAFDKTGTLTGGKPEVTDLVPLNQYPEGMLLQKAASLEAKSKHPIAEAIVRAAKERAIEVKEVDNFESVMGKGLRGKIDQDYFLVGNKDYFEELGFKIEKDEIETLENQGKTVALLGKQNEMIGIIAVSDSLRDEARETVEKLNKAGIIPVMLTGDNKAVAAATAEKLGIEKFYSGLLPEDKVRIVEELTQKHKHVIMVGDGVNDAPALAKAHVGIAMGAAGSDVAIETADIALMEDDLSAIGYLVKLSHKTMSVVRQNIMASILIKGAFVILTFPGLIKLWMAVAVGDMGLSLAVILNAMRLAKVSKKTSDFEL